MEEARRFLISLLQAAKNGPLHRTPFYGSKYKRYPHSANVYDSLAEAYEKTGKFDLARPNYEKAVQLGSQNNDPNLQNYKTNFDRVDGLLKKTADGKGK